MTIAVFVGVTAAAASGLETRYKLAAVLALGGFTVLAALPERRIACVVLWLLIHPFSVEKVFYIDAAEGPQFMEPTVVMNASDGPLILLAIFLLTETAFTLRSAFRWSRLTTIMSLFLIWSVISYVSHAALLDDGLTTSSPMALLQDGRLLLFVLLIQSAIRTRGDVMTALIACGAAIAVQTSFVGLSYATGHLFSYAGAVTGQATNLMGFHGADGGSMVRATGTMGQTNEQAMFHTFMTIPMIAFFVSRNPLMRLLSLAILAGSALALLLTFSRGAWIAFPFGLAIAGMIALRYRLVGRTAVFTGTALAAVGAVALLCLAQPIYDRFAYGDNGATESRLRMLRLAGDLFESNPLIGVGPGEYVEAAMRFYPPRSVVNQWLAPGESLPIPAPVIGRVDIVQMAVDGKVLTRPLPVHNKYMLILSELGLPGLMLWIWFYAALIKIAWQCSKMQDLFLKMVGISGIGTAAAELLYMNVDLFHEDKPLEVMLFIPALVVAASLCAQTRPAQRPGIPA